MNPVRGLFERLRIRRRPPSGPLTTAETTAAESRQETLAKDSDRAERKQESEDSRS
jgi:hypothetical protein